MRLEALDEDPVEKEPPTASAKEETPKEGTQDSASLDSKLDMILQLWEVSRMHPKLQSMIQILLMD